MTHIITLRLTDEQKTKAGALMNAIATYTLFHAQLEEGYKLQVMAWPTYKQDAITILQLIQLTDTIKTFL